MKRKKALRVLAFLLSAELLCFGLGAEAEERRRRGAFLGEERAPAERFRTRGAPVETGTGDQAEEAEESEQTGGGSFQMFEPPEEYIGIRMQEGRVERDADWNEEAEEKGEPAVAEMETERKDGKPERVEGPFEEAGEIVLFGGSVSTDLTCSVEAADKHTSGHGIHWWDGKYVKVKVSHSGASDPPDFSVGVRLATGGTTSWFGTRTVEAKDTKWSADSSGKSRSIEVYVPWGAGQTVQLKGLDDQSVLNLLHGKTIAASHPEKFAAFPPEKKSWWPTDEKDKTKIGEIPYVAVVDAEDDVDEGKAGEANNLSNPFHLGMKATQILTFQNVPSSVPVDKKNLIEAKVVGEAGWKMFYVDPAKWSLFLEGDKSSLFWEGPEHHRPFPELGTHQYLTVEAPFPKGSDAAMAGKVRVVLTVWDGEGHYDMKWDEVSLHDPTAGWVQQILTLMNKERAKVGQKALPLDSCMSQAAQTHSDWMAAKGYGYYYGPGGQKKNDSHDKSDPKYPATYTGNCTGKAPKGYGENISFRSTPKAVVDGWMKSTAGHKKTMLAPWNRGVGIGVASSGTSDFFTTAIFGD